MECRTDAWHIDERDGLAESTDDAGLAYLRQRQGLEEDRGQYERADVLFRSEELREKAKDGDTPYTARTR